MGCYVGVVCDVYDVCVPMLLVVWVLMLVVAQLLLVVLLMCVVMVVFPMLMVMVVYCGIAGVGCVNGVGVRTYVVDVCCVVIVVGV